MSKHTPEPWSLHRQAKTAVVGSAGFVTAACGGFSDNRREPEELSGELEANARRIVACINACAGIRVEILENEASGAHNWLASISKLIEQRDELVIVLWACHRWHLGDKYRFSDDPNDVAAWKSHHDMLTYVLAKQKVQP